MVIFRKNRYQLAKQITWHDVIRKMENEFELDTCSVHGLVNLHGHTISIPTIVLHNENQTKTVFDTVKEIEKEWTTTSCHLYTSFARGAATFGRHNDEVNVLIVGAIGKVSYKFDDGTIHIVEPGDALYIPAGVYHDPDVLSARVTLSISTQQTPEIL